MHTNDMHGYIDKYAQMKPIVDSIRSVNDNTLLISAGDMFSGNPVVDKYPEAGYPMIDLMNDMGYDISCLGNHEFDYGQDVLAKRIKQADFPIICANIYSEKSVLPEFKPYVYFTFSNVKIAFVGVIQITKDGYPESLITNMAMLGFSEPIAELQKYKSLKDSADIIIALTHLGYKRDKVVRKKIKYIDLLIGGHSHTILQADRELKKRPVFQVEDNNNYLGEIKLFVVDNKIVKIQNKIYEINSTLETDSILYAKIENYNNNESLKEVIGTLPNPIIDKLDLAQFLAESYKYSLNCDVGIQNFGGVRIDSLSKGDVTTKDIYSLDPFDNELYKGELTVNDLKLLIKSSFEMKGKLRFTFVGIDVQLESKNHKVYSIIIKDNNGKKLADNVVLKTVTNSYIVSKYKFAGSNKFTPTGVFSNDATIKYLTKKYPCIN